MATMMLESLFSHAPILHAKKIVASSVFMVDLVDMSLIISKSTNHQMYFPFYNFVLALLLRAPLHMLVSNSISLCTYCEQWCIHVIMLLQVVVTKM